MTQRYHSSFRMRCPGGDVQVGMSRWKCPGGSVSVIYKAYNINTYASGV